ncbi:MAG: 3-dehydroquinate synthase [Anaerolineae bacterium]|nr:3-dehydroquinate synthase [Anaerolineae bacterium]
MIQTQLTVRAGSAEYDVLIGVGLRAQMPDLLAARGLTASRIAVVSNTTVGPLYGAAMAEALGAALLTIPDGEQYKTLETFGRLCEAMLAAGLDRGSVVVAVGGGVVGDVAGFAAAAYMRGIRVAQTPTSLLAMVDSGVGGKTAVDLPGGKNAVGAFWQPALVVVDPDVLKTLPAAELRAGMAEVLKHGLIDDAGLFEQLEAAPVRDAAGIDAALLERAIAVKARVVAADEREAGVRQHLNLGHTFAHAIETASGYAWRHGDAVAVGLVGAAMLSARLGLCAPALVRRVERAVAAHGLPTRCGDLAPGALWEAMSADKKWRAGRARFVLIRDVGSVFVMEGAAREDVVAVLEELRSAG